MTGLLFCLSAAAMGVDYGWQPVAGGGIEYIIQIDPALVDSLKSGNDLFSDLPSTVSNVRRYRITVGKEQLPHHGEPPPAVIPASGQAPNTGQTPRTKPDEVDMSQLPGPVLDPALVLDPPANRRQSDENEPQRLAASDSAEPLGGRVTSFRQQRERSTSATPVRSAKDDGVPADDNKDPGDEAKASASESQEQKKAAKEELATQEAESPSDQSTAKAEQSLLTNTALTRIGLFTSVVANVFLLWVATGQRSRYRSLVRRMFEGSSVALANRDADAPRWERLPAPVKEGVPGASGDASNGT